MLPWALVLVSKYLMTLSHIHDMERKQNMFEHRQEKETVNVVINHSRDALSPGNPFDLILNYHSHFLSILHFRIKPYICCGKGKIKMSLIILEN